MVTKTGFTSNHCVRVRKVPQTNTYMSSKVKFDAAALLLLACWHGIKTGPAAPAASWLSRWNSEAFASQVQFWLPSVQPDMILCCFFSLPSLSLSFFFYTKKKKKSSSLLDPVMMESCCCHTGCFAWANKKWRVKKRGHCGVEEKKYSICLMSFFHHIALKQPIVPLSCSYILGKLILIYIHKTTQ